MVIAPTSSDILSYHERGVLMEDDHSRPNESMAVEPPTNLQEPASPQEREMPEPDEALSPNSNQQWTARCLDLEKLPVKTSVKHETSLRGIARDYNLKLGGDVNKDDIINSILESEGLPRKKRKVEPKAEAVKEAASPAAKTKNGLPRALNVARRNWFIAEEKRATGLAKQALIEVDLLMATKKYKADSVRLANIDKTVDILDKQIERIERKLSSGAMDTANANSLKAKLSLYQNRVDSLMKDLL